MRLFSPYAAAAVTLSLASTFAAAQGVERFPLDGRDVAVYNLVGTMKVEGSSGDHVVVEVTRVGGDAARLKIETGMLRGRNTLRIHYPEDRITYAERSVGYRATFDVQDDDTFGDDDDRGGRGNRHIEVRSSGGGLDAHADVRVLVPKGLTVRARNGVGETSVTNADGVLTVSVSSSHLTASHVRGTLTFETGSGGIDVSDATGDLNLDTGSGGAMIEGIHGGKVSVDVGSGSLRGRNIEATELTADVGSGGLRLSAVKTPRLHLEAGSGGSEVELLSPIEDVSVEAGSGGVTLRLPASTGASFDIETGSGSIDTDFEVKVQRMERHGSLRGTVGDGRGRVRVEAGSGTVRILKN
jgi:lia operon protein LiaG